MTVLVHEYGKAALMTEGLLAPGALVSGLLEAGHAVLAVDPLLCGEYNAQAGMVTRRNRAGGSGRPAGHQAYGGGPGRLRPVL